MVIVVMGVSGCGKTTVGKLLAERLSWAFHDADDYHPIANKARMSAGQPLTDEHRRPWLDALRVVIEQHLIGDTHAVVTCSALKRVYRDRLRKGDDAMAFVYLHGDPHTFQQRLRDRTDHFFAPELLDDQLRTLEPPGDDEPAITVDAAQAPKAVVVSIIYELQLR